MTMTSPGTGTTVLAQPLVLPCGLILPNRIMKAAMGEGLADPTTSDATPALIRLYERWADGGAGTLITGMINIQRGAGYASLVSLDEQDRHPGVGRMGVGRAPARRTAHRPTGAPGSSDHRPG